MPRALGYLTAAVIGAGLAVFVMDPPFPPTPSPAPTATVRPAAGLEPASPHAALEAPAEALEAARNPLGSPDPATVAGEPHARDRRALGRVLEAMQRNEPLPLIADRPLSQETLDALSAQFSAAFKERNPGP